MKANIFLLGIDEWLQHDGLPNLTYPVPTGWIGLVFKSYHSLCWVGLKNTLKPTQFDSFTFPIV